MASSKYKVWKPTDKGRSNSPSPSHNKEHHFISHKTSTSNYPEKTIFHKDLSRDDKKKGELSSKNKKNKKKKKKKWRSSSSSSSGSSDSDQEREELKLLQRLEAERQRLKEEKRKQKELMKAKETPEEKRARRLREKQEKERKRRERMGWDTEYQCYTNQDNPFGDSALTHTFVWTKKLAKEGVKTVSRDELEALNRQKQLENKIELEKVKQRRLEREAERAEREAEAAAAARAREAAQFSSWARHEDAFHLQQARLRSQIRIRDGRAKPIDLLAWYVSSEECVDALEMHEPYTYLNGLQLQDLEDLLEDIKVYEELESGGHQAYWQDVRTIVQDELGKLRRLAAPDARRDGVHRAVADDVTQIFKGKTGAQLAALQTQIEQKISGRRDGVDVGYWESLLSQLKAHMARARLRDRHRTNLRRKLQLLKREQGVQPAPTAAPSAAPSAAPTAAPSAAPTAASVNATIAYIINHYLLQKKKLSVDLKCYATGRCRRSGRRRRRGRGTEADAEEREAESGRAACVAQYEAGGYSPPPMSPRALEPATLVTAAELDRQRLAYLRARLHHAARPAPDTLVQGGGGHAALERLAERAMGPAADAAPFAAEAALPEAPCLWADKYRPRKPRYFNRVHTGFEWNKYNQTHYDMDNPPPKIVQGYKFNIFYPDLIDKSATPEFSLKPCADNPEFAVLRFHAGPPYEDIAFKIVSREWEYSYKRGFRCHFHNNIFQLWFHFKRYRYRR
ncbi:PREDICTED: cactin [Papilio xuthus]|uniref:Splicing factor Cactin n=1 Tax=Papilio xuthus TaxID=66420 RepID=A0AAJ7E4K0_PAPXU|nr:PREDICTED: cactin [Papilio xuthus]